jgi:hypothetical protein
VLRTRSPLEHTPKGTPPFDLHVLSAPPAFVLSQDQTLQEFEQLFVEQNTFPLFRSELFTLLVPLTGQKEVMPPAHRATKQTPTPQTQIFNQRPRQTLRLSHAPPPV